MAGSEQVDVNTLGFTSSELQKNFKQVEELLANFASNYENMDYDPFNLRAAHRMPTKSGSLPWLQIRKKLCRPIWLSGRKPHNSISKR